MSGELDNNKRAPAPKRVTRELDQRKKRPVCTENLIRID